MKKHFCEKEIKVFSLSSTFISMLRRSLKEKEIAQKMKQKIPCLYELNFGFEARRSSLLCVWQRENKEDGWVEMISPLMPFLHLPPRAWDLALVANLNFGEISAYFSFTFATNEI